MQQGQDGNNTNGVNKSKRSTRKTILRELKLPNPNEEPYEIYLGAPIGSDKSRYVEFIESKYRSIKSKLASYRNTQDYTHKGRAIIEVS